MNMKHASALPKFRGKTAYGLLGFIAKLILEEPKRYYQGWWKHVFSDVPHVDLAYRVNSITVTRIAAVYPACHTIACVAGWVCTYKAPSVEYGFYDSANGILGLTAPQAVELFSGDAIDRALIPQTTAYAEAGAAHIRAFMKKYRTQLLATKV